MIEWGRVPWPLWVFAVVFTVPGVFGIVAIETGTQAPLLAKVFFPVVMLAWLFYLLKGVRWVWILTLAVNVLGLGGDLISGSLTLLNTAAAVVSIGLLLHPATRRYCTSVPRTVAIR